MEALKIVALGDSLTVGYLSPVTGLEWPPYRPYTRFLEEMIRDAIAKKRKNIRLQVINKGLNGDLTESMVNRFDRDALLLNPSHIIILGGTNDIGWGIPVSEIYSHLKEMYDKTIHLSIKLTACAVPSILGYDSLIPPRLRLNEMIRRYCEAKGANYVDLFSATVDPATQRLSSKYSNDGLHLNAEGYRRLAETIFKDAFLPLINAPARSKNLRGPTCPAKCDQAQATPNE